jgi:hypothetical protein
MKPTSAAINADALVGTATTKPIPPLPVDMVVKMEETIATQAGTTIHSTAANRPPAKPAIRLLT